MTGFICLHEKAVIEEFLRRETDLHIYELGDLDEFFWPKTLWFGGKDKGGISSLVMLYVGLVHPTLLAMGSVPPLVELIRELSDLLPHWFYAHVSPGVEAGFQGKFQVESPHEHLKMSLKKPTLTLGPDESRAERLGPENLAEVLQLYKESYPANWFDPRMLETREYFGIREGTRLVSIAGVHVFSPSMKVAALGNIATAPSHRRKGLGTIVTRDLCRSLLKKVDNIGLNVFANNRAAISCYKKLGFEIVTPYLEFSVHRNS